MMIKNKDADAVLGIFRNPEREQYMFFPDEAFLDTSYVFFHKKKDKFEYKDINSLDGKQIGIIRGYHYSKEFDEADSFKKQPVPTVEQNIKKLLKGRIDLFIENKQVGIYFSDRMGHIDEITYSDKSVDVPKPHYIAFSMKPGNKEIAKKFGAALKDFRQTQRFKKILSDYGQ